VLHSRSRQFGENTDLLPLTGTELQLLGCVDTNLVSMIKESEKMVDVIQFEVLSATFIRTEGKYAISQTYEPVAGKDSTRDLVNTKHECNHASSTFVSITKVGLFQWPSTPTPGSFANSTDSVPSGIMHGTTPPLVNMTS